MEISIIQTAANYPAKTDYRHLTEINSHYYRLSLMRTLTQGPYNAPIKGLDCIQSSQPNKFGQCSYMAKAGPKQGNLSMLGSRPILPAWVANQNRGFGLSFVLAGSAI